MLRSFQGIPCVSALIFIHLPYLTHFDVECNELPRGSSPRIDPTHSGVFYVLRPHACILHSISVYHCHYIMRPRR